MLLSSFSINFSYKKNHVASTPKLGAPVLPSTPSLSAIIYECGDSNTLTASMVSGICPCSSSQPSTPNTPGSTTLTAFDETDHSVQVAFLKYLQNYVQSEINFYDVPQSPETQRLQVISLPLDHLCDHNKN